MFMLNENDSINVKKANTFICEIEDSTGIFIPKFVIFSVERPKFDLRIDEDGNRITWWHPLYMTVYDPIIPSSAQAIWAHLERGDHFNIKIKLLGPVGDVIEQWLFIDARIVSVDFGKLDWTNSTNILTIQLKIKYESAELLY